MSEAGFLAAKDLFLFVSEKILSPSLRSARGERKEKSQLQEAFVFSQQSKAFL